MQKKTIVLLIIALLIIAGAGWAYSNWKAYAPISYVQESADATGATTTTTVNTETGTATEGSPSYKLADIATHNSASSCYSVINGKVYDLTLWINMHPGGKNKILSICGIDGTSSFEAKHGGESKPLSALSRFHVGNLAQ